MEKKALIFFSIIFLFIFVIYFVYTGLPSNKGDKDQGLFEGTIIWDSSSEEYKPYMSFKNDVTARIVSFSSDEITKAITIWSGGFKSMTLESFEFENKSNINKKIIFNRDLGLSKDLVKASSISKSKIYPPVILSLQNEGSRLYPEFSIEGKFKLFVRFNK